MRITFIYLDLAAEDSGYTGYFHHGIASLSAVLKKAGFQTNLIQLTREISKEEFQDRIKKLRPDLICFSSTTHVFPFVRQYAAAVKEVISAPIIVGGVHASVCPEEVLADKNIDMALRGEGEMALLEICRKLEKGESLENIGNVWLKKDGKIIRNKISPLITSLDELPFPDREIFDYSNLNLEKKGIGTFMFSRGCPYHCAFCCEATLRGLYPNPRNYHRFRSPSSVVQEIKEAIEKYPFIKFVRMDDDLLFAKKEWVSEFIPIYKKEIGLPFSADMRVNLINEELLKKLKEGGCHLLRIGVESGNDFILKKVLDKGITTDQVKKAFKIAKKEGIKTQAYNMLGLPGEGAKEILDTIKLNAQIKPDLSVVSIFYPYKGTALYEVCLKEGILKDKDQEIPKNYYSYSVLSLPTIRKEQIPFFLSYFHLLKILYSFLFSSSLFRPMVFLADQFFSFRYTPEIMKFTITPLRKLVKFGLKNDKKTDTEAL